MKNKISSSIAFGIFALVMFTSFVSADIDLTAADTEFSQLDGDSLTVNISGIGSGNTVTFTFSEVKDYSGKQITFTPVPTSLTANGSISITTHVPTGFDFFGKEYATTLTATEKNSTGDFVSDDPISLTFRQTDFCSWDNNDVNESHINDNDLRVRIKDVSVKGFGNDEEWYPLDEVELEIEVRNQNSDYDIDDIVLEWGLFNKETGEWAIEVIDEKEFNLKDGEKKTITLNFKLDESDLDVSLDELKGGKYVLYVRATGDVDDDAAGEYTACHSTREPAEASKTLTVEIRDDFVILDNIQVSDASCGSNIQVSADVWNVGDDDQDNVYVVIFNKELGINKKVVIGDINSFDDTGLDVLIPVPKNAEEKSYTLTFYVYNEDNDVYESDNEDDDEAEFPVSFKVEGNCVVDTKLTLTAYVESGGNAGEELVVKVTVTNTDSNSRTLTFEAGDYTSWAELVEVVPTSMSMGAGETRDVLFTFNVDDKASGKQAFNIEVFSDNKLIVTQPASVVIQEKAGWSITGNLISEDNWYIWAIGALNLLLVIAIIVVAVKMARR